MPGLNDEQVKKAIRLGKTNRTADPAENSVFHILKRHVFNYFNAVNTCLLVLVLSTGQYKNALFYFTVVFHVGIVVFREWKAKKAIDQLSLTVSQKTQVMRNGGWDFIEPEDLVPEDYIRIGSGQQIPADCKILDGMLEVNESLLTGEEDYVLKSAGEEIYAGSYAVSGGAFCTVVRTGADNRTSVIVKDAKRLKLTKSALQQGLQRMLKLISVAVLPLGILLFYTQYTSEGATYQTSVVKTAAAVIGMIPEGLMVLISVALAVSATRLAAKKVLVQDLYSIEELARVDVVCMDKTGTLTTGHMKVKDYVSAPGLPEEEVLSEIRRYLGQTTDRNGTVLALIEHFGRSQKEPSEVYPFSSVRKFGAVRTESKICFLGAPSALFPQGNEWVEQSVSAYRKEGLRVLVFAIRQDRVGKGWSLEGLIPLAILVLEDELQKNVSEVVAYLYRNDVDVYVISGDDPETAGTIAKQAGVLNSAEAVDLSRFPAENFKEAILNQRIFGRAKPEDKKEIIRILKEEGHVVAMIGDGVNDVPALKAADLSIAMPTSAGVVKNMGSIVLTDGDFAHIPEIISEGRQVINNIGRSAAMYLIKTGFSVFLSFYAILLSEKYPFLPIQLTLISACCVGVPTALLQFEKNDERPEGKFLRDALFRSLPASLSVFCVLLLEKALLRVHILNDRQMNVFLVIMTVVLYLGAYTRIYRPLNRNRTAILAAVTVAFSALLIGLSKLLELHLLFDDIPYLIGLFAFTAVINGIWVFLLSAVHKRLKKT